MYVLIECKYYYLYITIILITIITIILIIIYIYIIYITLLLLLLLLLLAYIFNKLPYTMQCIANKYFSLFPIHIDINNIYKCSTISQFSSMPIFISLNIYDGLVVWQVYTLLVSYGDSEFMLVLI